MMAGGRSPNLVISATTRIRFYAWQICVDQKACFATWDEREGIEKILTCLKVFDKSSIILEHSCEAPHDVSVIIYDKDNCCFRRDGHFWTGRRELSRSINCGVIGNCRPVACSTVSLSVRQRRSRHFDRETDPLPSREPTFTLWSKRRAKRLERSRGRDRGSLRSRLDAQLMEFLKNRVQLHRGNTNSRVPNLNVERVLRRRTTRRTFPCGVYLKAFESRLRRNLLSNRGSLSIVARQGSTCRESPCSDAWGDESRCKLFEQILNWKSNLSGRSSCFDLIELSSEISIADIEFRVSSNAPQVLVFLPSRFVKGSGAAQAIVNVTEVVACRSEQARLRRVRSSAAV